MLSPLTPFSRWVGAQPVIPEMYFDVKTEEQRYKRLAAILEELEKYVNYMVDAFNELYEEFEALKARVDELEQRMDEAEHRLDVLEERLDAVEEGIRQFYEEFTTFVEKTEKHFNEVDNRLSALEGRMDAAEGRLDALEAAVAKLRDEFDTFVTQTDEHLATVDSRLDALEQATTDAQTELSALADAYKGFAVGDYLQLTETEGREGFNTYTVDDAQMPNLDCANYGKMPVGETSFLPTMFTDYNSGSLMDKDATQFDLPTHAVEFDYTGKLTQAHMDGSYQPISDGKLCAVDDDENYFTDVGLASKKMLADITDAVDTANEAIDIAKTAAGGGVTQTEGRNGIETTIEDRDGVLWLVADGKELSDKADAAQATADEALETAKVKVSNVSAKLPLTTTRDSDDNVVIDLDETFRWKLQNAKIEIPEFNYSNTTPGGSSTTGTWNSTIPNTYAGQTANLNADDSIEGFHGSTTLRIEDNASWHFEDSLGAGEETFISLDITITKNAADDDFTLHVDWYEENSTTVFTLNVAAFSFYLLD